MALGRAPIILTIPPSERQPWRADPMRTEEARIGAAKAIRGLIKVVCGLGCDECGDLIQTWRALLGLFILASFWYWVAGAEQHDDMTALVLKLES